MIALYRRLTGHLRPRRTLTVLSLLVPAFVLAASGIATAAPGAGTAAAPGGAVTAAAPNPGFVVTPVQAQPDPGFLLFRLSADFPVGDCVALGDLSWVQLTRPTASTGNTSFVNWHQVAYTTHTNNGDVWHGTFRFLNSSGQVVYSAGPLDGRKMTVTRALYDWTVPSPRTALSPAAYASIVSVLWQGAC